MYLGKPYLVMTKNLPLSIWGNRHVMRRRQEKMNAHFFEWAFIFNDTD
jgi:hypothetical protein